MRRRSTIVRVNLFQSGLVWGRGLPRYKYLSYRMDVIEDQDCRHRLLWGLHQRVFDWHEHTRRSSMGGMRRRRLHVNPKGARRSKGSRVRVSLTQS